jgi:hypothetical protein
MTRLPHHLLAHLCSLMLLAPAGWCCMEVLPQANAEESAAPKACCRCAQEVPPRGSEPEQTPPQDKCPCAERQSTTPVAAEKPQPAVALPAPLPIVAISLSDQATAPEVSVPFPGGSLHVWNCVWLC